MSNLNGAYYGPSIPPPSRSYRGDSCCGGCFSCCCGCIFNCILGLICKILTVVIVLVGIVALLFWLMVRPNVLKFHVSDATLSKFSYDNNTLFYDLAANVTIRNPNRRVGVYYDDIEALTLYQTVRFGYQTLGPFFQHPKNTTVLNPVFKSQQVIPFTSDQVSDMETEKKSGVFSINLRLNLKVRFKIAFFKTRTVQPKILCALEVPLESRKGASSNGAFQETRCDWDIKRMLFH
ncbi:hypothetical protein VNO77_15837 [Canavalia gladiata]|uniref:Late embryogenesis abundant protein LEA-2 subgroup domain-containing protein n=1 Tax=Canavalia gladiata TaxID=3824 RepID=A0AAN9QW17_CANGL